MAHRKNSLEDAYVELEKKQPKKTAPQQTTHQKKESNKNQQPSQVDHANPDIIDEHGEY